MITNVQSKVEQLESYVQIKKHQHKNKVLVGLSVNKVSFKQIIVILGIMICFLFIIMKIITMSSQVNNLNETIHILQFDLKEKKAIKNDLYLKEKLLSKEKKELLDDKTQLESSVKKLEQERADLALVLGYKDLDIMTLKGKITHTNDLIGKFDLVIEYANQVQEIKASINSLNNNNNLPIDSHIILKRDQFSKLQEWVNIYKSNQLNFALLYRMTRDGFSHPIFHEKCDNIANTLIIIHSSQGTIFGGFTQAIWDQNSNDYKSDNDAFLFNLSLQKKYQIIDSKNAIFSSKDTFIVFGRGDLFIKNHQTVTSIFPKTYGMGSKDFELTNNEEYIDIREMEVFKIQFAWFD